MYLRFNGEKAQPGAETELDTYRQQGLSLVVCLMMMMMMMKMFSEEAWAELDIIWQHRKILEKLLLSCWAVVVRLLLLSDCCCCRSAHNLKGRQSWRKHNFANVDIIWTVYNVIHQVTRAKPALLLLLSLSLFLLQLHSVAGSALEARLQLFSCDHKNCFSGETDCSLSGAKQFAQRFN